MRFSSAFFYLISALPEAKAAPVSARADASSYQSCPLLAPTRPKGIPIYLIHSATLRCAHRMGQGVSLRLYFSSFERYPKCTVDEEILGLIYSLEFNSSGCSRYP